MIALLLIGLAASALGASLDSCQVGEWSDWSACTPSSRCPSIPVHSYPMEATTEWDEGNSVMERIMAEKTRQWKAIDECMAKGTCPEFMRKPIEGSFDCIEGMSGDNPCLNIKQLSYQNFVALAYNPTAPGDTNPRGNDIWGWVDPLTGREYSIVGLSGATSFVDVTDPEKPLTVGIIYTATTFSTWRDMKVIGNYAYIVSEAANHGLQVFDLTRLRGRTTPMVFQPDAVNNDFGQAHNIVANEETNYLYVVGARSGNYPLLCRGGLLVIDVADPLKPTFAGCFGDDGYVHDAQCVNYKGPDMRYKGRSEICFCFNENSFTLVDVTDKKNMRMIAKSGYINVAYTHQGWVTDDHGIVLLDDEQDEQGKPPNQQFTKTYVWDIKDLHTPTLKTIYESSERSIDHNQYMIGDFTFQGNYESGLRVLHLDRETYTLTQVAYIDVFPARTTAEFNGVWSVYPYLKSGNVLVNSINHGHFVVQLDWAAIHKLVAEKTAYAEQTRTRPILSSGLGATCPALVQTKTCSAPTFC